MTLGHEDMPVQASIRLLALVLRRPNHILANSLVPVMFCDYDYEETNMRSPESEAKSHCLISSELNDNIFQLSAFFMKTSRSPCISFCICGQCALLFFSRNLIEEILINCTSSASLNLQIPHLRLAL